MNFSHLFRTLYERSPDPLRELGGAIVGCLPPSSLYGGAFRDTQQVLRISERWTPERRFTYQLGRLSEVLAVARNKVPHYRRLFADLEDARDPFALLTKLPLLTREAVRILDRDLLPEDIKRNSYKYSTTGGTSGRPLGFYVTYAASVAEWAFMLHAWQRRGFRWGDRRAVLRGSAIHGHYKNTLWKHDPLNHALVFSSFDLSDQNLRDYVKAMQRYRPLYLHAYPSSATILAQHLSRTGTRIPSIKGLLIGSENLYPAQRRYLEEVFGCKTITWYGHSEKCILASECEVQDGYHVFPEYGVVELVDSKGSVIHDTGKRGLLVGTGFINQATMFIRYQTDDEAEWDFEQCACGRSEPRIKNVRGRWNQEFLLGRSGALIAMAALNLHGSVYTRMRQFQFGQDKPGLAVLRVVKGDQYSSNDERAIMSELGDKLSGEIELAIEYVSTIPTTPNGKFRFIDQRLTLDYPDWEAKEPSRLDMN